ncbi:MAG: preprotein translocase subunit SecG [Thermoleophilia bacterium]|nr:preprotein translocase subunit SecG [Thermoleophilia bacterium]
MTYFLVALDTIFGIGLLVLIFLHSGKDSGLSTTFGGSGAFGGSGVVQKNLDRLTVACGLAFFIVSIALAYIV